MLEPGFYTIFGAYLHMKNWEALGEPQRATQSKNWVIAGLTIQSAIGLAPVLLPDTEEVDSLVRSAGFALVFLWYYTLGKSQQTYVAARYGKNYPRRGWTKPLLVALLALLIFVLLIFAVTFAFEAAFSAA